MRFLSKCCYACRVLAVAGMAVGGLSLMAQSASLHGTVSDPSGAVVPGAKVTAKLLSAGSASGAASSDASGVYQIANLKAGSYEVEVEAAGFKTALLASVAVAEGQSATADVKLALAGVSTEVRVIDTTAPNGSYHVDVANMGPLGTVDVLDTPYTVNTVPTNLMENQQARSFSQILAYLPSAQMEARGGMDVGRPQTRGFEGEVISNGRMDGMNIIDTTTYPMEQFDRIEVQSGLSGIYGKTTPAGTFNYVLKRPTERPTAKIGWDLDSPTTTTVNGDFGGHVSKYFGYRADVLHTNGTGYVDASHTRRELVSASIDVNPFKHTQLQFNGSDYIDHKHGYPGSFGYGSGLNTVLFDAPDPTQRGLGQSWAGNDLHTRTLSGRILQGIGSLWSLSVGGLHQTAERHQQGVTNTFTNNTGTFTVKAGNGYNIFTSQSNQGYLNGRVKTGRFSHELMVGSNGFEWGNQSTTGAAACVADSVWTAACVTKASSSLSDRKIYSAPSFTSLGSVYKGSTSWSQSLVFGDTVMLSSHWMINFIGTQTWMGSRSFTSAGAVTGTPYKDGGFSPSASLLYKPASNMSLYFTYASSIYSGDQAPSSTSTPGIKNPLQFMPPYHSKQYEAGYKVRLRGAEVDLAAYRMNRPYAYTDSSDMTFKVAGNQVNDGLDLMVKGKVLPNLNVFGGFTWLNPTLQDTGKATTEGKQVVGVPRIQQNYLLEYNVPRLRGLFVNFDWRHIGRKAANDTNTIWLNKTDTFDLGARYDQRIKFADTTWRFSVTNVASAQYWASIFPGSINGQSTNYSGFLGSPRMVSASVQFRFTKGK